MGWYNHIMRYCLWLIMLLSGALAQSYKPSCSETLSLSPDTFTTVYAILNKNISQAGTDQAYYYWIRCKEQENLRRLANYPAIRPRILRFRELAYELQRACIDAQSTLAGGGTFFGHLAARSGHIIETFVGELITLTTSSVGRTQDDIYTTVYDSSLKRINETVIKLRNTSEFEIISVSRSDWNKQVDQVENAYKKLLELIGSRKDATSANALAFISNSQYSGIGC